MQAKIDPTREAIQVFLEIKKTVIDHLEGDKSEEVGSKLRTRAREIPEMIVEMGLIPTISYCIAKANISNFQKVTNSLELGTFIDELKNVKSEELAYALYSYVILKYMSIIAGNLNGVKFGLDDLVRKEKAEVSDLIIKYIGALTENMTKIPITQLLLSYLLQFKRLTEAVYKPEER